MGLKTRLIQLCVWRLASGAVASGPFKGLRYIRSGVGRALAPKIIGTYERELHATIRQIIASSAATG